MPASCFVTHALLPYSPMMCRPVGAWVARVFMCKGLAELVKYHASEEARLKYPADWYVSATHVPFCARTGRHSLCYTVLLPYVVVPLSPMAWVNAAAWRSMYF